jgi:very-short-patch-repair endonuclease
MTLPEVKLWSELRKRPGGFKFRRQHPIETYVLDFYCPEARLAIEVDGIAHDIGSRPMHDGERDKRLEKRAVRTLRVPAKDLLNDIESVVRMVIAECQVRCGADR